VLFYTFYVGFESNNWNIVSTDASTDELLRFVVFVYSTLYYVERKTSQLYLYNRVR